MYVKTYINQKGTYLARYLQQLNIALKRNYKHITYHISTMLGAKVWLADKIAEYTFRSAIATQIIDLTYILHMIFKEPTLTPVWETP